MITNNTAARFHSIRCRLYAARLSARAALLDALHALRKGWKMALLTLLAFALVFALGAVTACDYLETHTTITYDEGFLIDTPAGWYFQPDPDYPLYPDERIAIVPAAWMN